MRAGRIELPSTAWKAVILPLNHARDIPSEYPESNRSRIHPMDVYYHYTILRLSLIFRAAGSRTQTVRSQSVYTTAILQPVSLFSECKRSECRESNPGLTNPNRVYYRCTTLRLGVYTPCATRENRTPVSSLARTHSTTKPWSQVREIIAYLKKKIEF